MKPRGLMIIHHFRPGSAGGAELQAERLAKQLVQLGHPIQVLTRLTAPGALPEETADGVQIHRVPYLLPYWITRDNADTFQYLVRQRHTYDLLHAHLAFGHAVVAVVAARCLGKKAIVKIACAGEYGDLCLFSKFAGFAAALKVLHQADAVVAISREVERELLQYGFPAHRIVRIPNGVDTDFFRRTQPMPERGKTQFILIGRRHPQKGIDTTLLAAQRLLAQGLGDQFEIRLYGADYAEHDYRALARDLGVVEHVRFFPFERDIRAVYHSAHCFLLPSRGEGMSNSLLEAMALELPVIATPVSGTPDVVDDGVDGVLVPPDAPAALAAAMARVIADPAFAHQLGQRARRKVETQFALPRVAQQYSELYSRLCAAEA